MILLENTYDNSEAVMLESDEEIDTLFDILEENGIIFCEDGIILEGETVNSYLKKKYNISNDKNSHRDATIVGYKYEDDYNRNYRIKKNIMNNNNVPDSIKKHMSNHLKTPHGKYGVLHNRSDRKRTFDTAKIVTDELNRRGKKTGDMYEEDSNSGILSRNLDTINNDHDAAIMYDAVNKHLRREEHKNKNKKSVNEFCDLI